MMLDPMDNHEVTILVVEDSPTQAEQLKYYLERQGYRVEVAENGKVALDLVHQVSPTLVITDVVMPEMDGYQLCQEIKRNREFQSIPVILLTSLANPQDVIKGLECGADNFITKPFDQKYLFSRIQYALANRELSKMDNMQMGVEVFFAGNRHFITANRLQILNLLLSTYEAAIQKNHELTQLQTELRNLNEMLEQKIAERTLALREEIAERRQAQEEVYQLNQTLERRVQERTVQLQEAVKQLESFSYSISHDLRGPLRAVNSFSAILMKDCAPQLDEMALRYLQIINNSALKMDQLIRDLLGFARATRQEIVKTTIDMEELSRDTFRDLLVQVNPARQIEFSCDPLPPARGDKALIQQVWVNLLSNAIKFSRNQEQPIIEIKCRPDSNPNIYSVRDNGAGFDMNYANKLFGVFHRLHSETEFEGTGVGLAIVHQIIHRHGGTIWAEAKEGEGATFLFTLPTEAS